MKHWSAFVLIVFGLFLIADKLFVGAISFVYPPQIAFVDDFFGHGLLGLGFVLIGFNDLRRS